MRCTRSSVRTDDFVILSILYFSDVHVKSLPVEVQRADALYDLPKMRHKQARKTAHSRESFGRGGSPGISRTLGFHLERRVSLMLSTVLIAAMGVNRTLLRRFMEVWAIALAVRREVFRQLRRVQCCSCNFCLHADGAK